MSGDGGIRQPVSWRLLLLSNDTFATQTIFEFTYILVQRKSFQDSSPKILLLRLAIEIFPN